MMTEMPLGLQLQQAWGALTHAIGRRLNLPLPPTDACALKAIELISSNLRAALKWEGYGAREQMAYAQFFAGMAFNNA